MKYGIHKHPRYGHVQSIAMVERTNIPFNIPFADDDADASHGGLPSSKIDLSISCTNRKIEASFVRYAKGTRIIVAAGCEIDDEFVVSILEYAMRLKAEIC